MTMFNLFGATTSAPQSDQVKSGAQRMLESMLGIDVTAMVASIQAAGAQIGPYLALYEARLRAMEASIQRIEAYIQRASAGPPAIEDIEAHIQALAEPPAIIAIEPQE